MTDRIIGGAIAVHREIGPGALESTLDCGYRIDLLVESKVIVEVKSVERFEPVHTAQVISYLRLSRHKVGLLINFNVKWLADRGIKRIVNGFPD